MKKILKKIVDFITRLFTGISPILQKAVSIGATIAENVKNFDTANPIVADLITQLIPGTVDDKIKQKLREYLPKVVIQLRLVEAAKGLKDPDEIMLAAVKVIQQMDGDYKSAFLHNLSIIAAQVAADGKLSWGDAVYLLEWYYQNKVKPANEQSDNG